MLQIDAKGRWAQKPGATGSRDSRTVPSTASFGTLSSDEWTQPSLSRRGPPRLRLFVSTSSSEGQGPDSPKMSSRSEQASPARPSPVSSAPQRTSESTSSTESQPHSEQRSPSSSFLSARIAWTTRSSLVVPPLPAKSQSMLARSSRRSTKQPAAPPSSSGSVAQGGRPFTVEFRPQVAKIVTTHGGVGCRRVSAVDRRAHRRSRDESEAFPQEEGPTRPGI
jgi:hypothetical protein